MDIILRTEGLSRSFGGFKAVSDLNFSVRKGTIHALIGPNGAGKTTIFNLLTKFMPPTSGRVFYKDQDITALKSWQVARMGIVRSFQISAVFPRMTVRENVRVALQRATGRSYEFWRHRKHLDYLNEQVDALLESVGLGAESEIPAMELPYGRKRALEIATTLALDPELLLLDEPMAGLGQDDVKRIAELIKDLVKTRTILMVEHNLSVVAELSDVITVLTRGEILAEGSYAEVSALSSVQEAYLGVGDE